MCVSIDRFDLDSIGDLAWYDISRVFLCLFLNCVSIDRLVLVQCILVQYILVDGFWIIVIMFNFWFKHGRLMCKDCWGMFSVFSFFFTISDLFFSKLTARFWRIMHEIV